MTSHSSKEQTLAGGVQNVHGLNQHGLQSATCTLTAGKVTNIKLITKGYGYSRATSLALAFSGGGGAGAVATATLVHK